VLFPGHLPPKAIKRRGNVYLNKAAEIVALWNSGRSSVEIRQLVGVTHGYVSTTLARSRQRGNYVRYARPGNQRRFKPEAPS